jgi:hypothetical protein
MIDAPKIRRRASRLRVGRDTTASPIEEFAIEARADDDFGVRQLELIYSVNGGPEQTKKLIDSAGKPCPNFGSSHVLPRGAEGRAGRLRLLFRARDRQHRAEHLLTCTSSASASLTSSSVRPCRWAVGAGGATVADARSSARSPRRRTTSSAIASR